MERRKRLNPLKYYTPNGKCEEFVKMTAGDGFIYIFSAANSVGKTALMCNLIGNMLLSPQNKWFDLPFYRRFRRKPLVGRIIAPEKIISNIINPELKKWLPPHRYTRRKLGKMYYSKYEVGPHSFDLLTTEQEIQQFEGATLDWLWMDDFIPETIFNASVARFRFGGKIFITLAPLQKSAFLFERADMDAKILYADIEDNCIEHGVRGILRHEDIVKMISAYDDEEREARQHGRPMYLRGLVYKKFKRGIHTIPRFTIPKHWPRWMAIDPHDRQPNAMVWAALDPTGDLYFYDEDFSTDLTKETVKRIIEKERQYGRATRRLIDPNFGLKRYGNSGRTVKEEYEIESRLQGYPMRFAPANDDIPAGHKKVREWLNYDEAKPIDERNHPKLYFFDDLQNTIHGMTHYMYEDWKAGKDTKSQKERPQEKYKHFPDAVRYIIMDNPTNRVLRVHRPQGRMY